VCEMQCVLAEKTLTGISIQKWWYDAYENAVTLPQFCLLLAVFQRNIKTSSDNDQVLEHVAYIL